MLNLFPIIKIITTIATLYAFFILLIFSLFNISIIKVFTFSLGIELIIILIFYFGWRKIWKKFTYFNNYFPDLNGEWQVDIKWIRGDKEGIKKGIIHIKQSLLNISMELETDESESSTLVVIPKKDQESGRVILYYIYENTPQFKQTNIDSHKGTAILKLSLKNSDTLSGNYFTDRQTKGTLILKRKK